MRLNGYGEDLKYAEMLAGKLGIELYPKLISVEEALATIPEVIKIMGSFDPALPNDLAIYLGLRLAREKGIESVITGDGADELFAGYSYMFDLDLKEYLPRLAEKMNFSSNRLGAHLGIEVKQPFLDRDLIDFALSIDPELKVREHRGARCGKWVLREAFAPRLPEEIIWQTKRPIEVGPPLLLPDLPPGSRQDSAAPAGRSRLPRLRYGDSTAKLPLPGLRLEQGTLSDEEHGKLKQGLYPGLYRRGQG